MKKKSFVFGKLLNRYRISKKDIEDLNKKYEAAKNNLSSYGHLLAGRLDSELDIIPILEKTNIFKGLITYMKDYIDQAIEVGCIPSGNYNLNILSCWINDMKEGEYNPPHTHHDGTGFSTVLFLKIPQFINDTRDPHKFKDGRIGFVGVDGVGTNWEEPRVGDFYIFRADHQHCVMPFKVKRKGEIRRSMSFNFVLEDLKKTDE
jgi:hypothetical protein